MFWCNRTAPCPPRQSPFRCGVLQSAPHYVSGRTLHSTACRDVSIVCLRTVGAVCRINYGVLVPMVECDLSWLVVANYADWSPLVGICPSIQKARLNDVVFYRYLGRRYGRESGDQITITMVNPPIPVRNAFPRKKNQEKKQALGRTTCTWAKK